MKWLNTSQNFQKYDKTLIYFGTESFIYIPFNEAFSNLLHDQMNLLFVIPNSEKTPFNDINLLCENQSM